MDWLDLLAKIFEVCVIPLLGVLTTYLVVYLKTKRDELIEKSQSDLLDKYIDKLHETITDCVIATNQTYVETLKKEGKFDAEAQKIAFEKTYEAVISILSLDAYEYLGSIIGDLNGYITTKIEAEVNKQKL